MGLDPALVLHGGGNVSVKGSHRTLLGDEIPTIFVKRSGANLATLEPADLPGVDLTHLSRLRTLESLSDDEMVNEIRTHLFDASAPTPSIETLVHAFLPHRYIDHSHADAVLAVTNHAHGAELARRAMGDRVGVLHYIRPGFELAKAAAECYERDTSIEGIVLLYHGLITFGDDARTCYERHIRLVNACDAFLEQESRPRAAREPRASARAEIPHPEPRASARAKSPTSVSVTAQTRPTPTELVTRLAPILRGLLAEPTGDEDQPHRRSILEWRAGDELLALIDDPEIAALAESGPLTGDHLIRTKAKPLLIEKPPWSDDATLRSQLAGAVDAYRRDYRRYVESHGGTAAIDASPRVVIVPGAGLLCWGNSKADARITADVAELTLVTKTRAAALGPYQSLPSEHWPDMEFRAIQRAKLLRWPNRPLEGQVVVISGAAGAIGAAVAHECAEAGAHVALTDIDADRLARVVARIEQERGAGVVVGGVMDVTDEASVVSGYGEIVRTFGGVDVIVPNAGIAHVAAIESLAVADFRRVLEINAVGYLLLMREGIKVLKRQGLGGNIVINSSKNVFGPGKDFGAYSASKAAGHQLGKVAAIELAPYGIRVNMINADAIFGDEETPSGLWATVGPERARSRSINERDLPEYYRDRNLLKARVRGRHVGRAVVFFASNATPTTGATLPVDGGVVEAFPR